ncbi:Receptor-like protein kinase [Quillaja saponaria]|uniref:Receptor-like protein kinase n=1 Tax=Quillaja saponaria TaxID=32244 RepID=A0AAD7M0B5_QUISA|nr:Receptor-like protein kinase [Quillaja saponaria]
MLRYSNRSIFGIMERSPSYFQWERDNVTSVDGFNQVLRDLFDRLRIRATSGGSSRKFAAANATGPDSQTIYALVQCTPDLSKQDCDDCLVGALGDIPICCYGKEGGSVVAPSCGLKYEIYRFFEPTADTLTSMGPPPLEMVPPESNGTNTTITNGKTGVALRVDIITAVSTVSFLVLIIIICIYLRIMRKPRGNFETADISSEDSLQFDFDKIKVATNNFSDENKLGQGGFGAVYQGRLYNGQDIAVKRLSDNSRQGNTEFKNEVLLVAKLQHRNLVRLLGFCLEGREKLLIYEFLPNKSLDHFIFDPTKRVELDWVRRYKIIVGIARGLLYLHQDSQLRIIHHDLKASNVLLDAELNPKISDFGMARLFVIDQSHGNTRRIAGTYGYMAPEYALQGHFSVKTDVFSFGVLVLEIVSGQKNGSFCIGEETAHLLSYAWESWRKGTPSNIIDPILKGGSTAEMLRCIHIGLLCVQENVADRPTMASAVLMLSTNSLTLPIPTQPGFLMKIGSESYRQSSETRSEFVQQSANEASFTDPYPR